MEYKLPRGTLDFLPEETIKRNLVTQMLQSIAEDFAYRQIETPMFEATEVFSRSSGEASDIVSKQMYTFIDRGQRSMSLRPEGTAGVIRAFNEHKIYATTELPYKVYYISPAFRYERPQTGRYRQHTQFGLESIGANLVENDVELILQVFHMFNSLGLKNFYFKLNSIGDAEARQKYVEKLKEFFKPHLEELCEDCHHRYAKNPLRILDCKVDSNKDFFQEAPKIIDNISSESQARFQNVCDYLEEYQIPFEVDSNLVRGLDYYSETVFEVYIKGKENEGAVGAGGRYNNLVKDLGGPDLPCVGFASGLERLIEALDQDQVFADIDDGLMAYVMPLDKLAFTYSFNVAMHLRFNGIPTEMDYAGRSIKAQFKSVDKRKAKFAILVGSSEMLASTVMVKDNTSKVQEEVHIDKLVDYLFEKIMRMQEENTAKEHECECGHHHDDKEHECECGHHHDDKEHECECGHHHDDKDHECCHHHDDKDHECCHHHDDKDHECEHHHDKKTEQSEEHECKCHHKN